LKSAEYRRSGRQSKVKRLTDSFSPKSYQTFLSYRSRHLDTPVLRIPKMSKQSLKRWLDARDAYLGHNYPYIQERFERYRRRRRRKTKSTKTDDQMIDYEEAISIFSVDSNRFSVPELNSSGKQRRLSRKDSRIKPISQSETNLRRNRGLLECIKTFVQSRVRSLSRLSLRKPRQQKKPQIIHDNFDDKCVGTEISEQRIYRTNIERNDQAIQVNLARPQIELHHEFDTSMVEGERKQRIRSVRRYVEYSDKATETDFILNFANVEKERREEKEENEVDDDEDDKATRRSIEKEKIDPYNEQYNAQQEQHQLPSMSNSGHRKTRKNEPQQAQKLTNTGNRIVPLTDLFPTSTNDENNDQQNGSRSTIFTPTESNASTHEQLQRYDKNKY
jgi:hypothetical protein